MTDFDKELYQLWSLILDKNKLDELFTLYLDSCVENNDKEWDLWLLNFLDKLTSTKEYLDDPERKEKLEEVIQRLQSPTTEYRIGNKYWYWKSNILTEYIAKRNVMFYSYPFDKYAVGNLLTRYPMADTKLETYVILNCFWKSYIYVPLKSETTADKQAEILADLTYFCSAIKTPYTTDELVKYALSYYFRSMVVSKTKYHYSELGELDELGFEDAED